MGYKLHVAKLDTISPSILNAFDFEADELLSVSSDSLYSFKASRIKYSETTKTLTANSFSIHPNYNEYAFTSRNTYQTDRIEADFKKLLVQKLSVSKYIKSGILKSSGIEIGEMDLNAFSDKRIKFKHVNKEVFQNMIYNYPGYVKIDSISLNGSLSEMDAGELNPILEKNAFINVTTGKIDAMNFSFTANNTKATGKMTLLYHGLDVTLKNKRTDDNTAVKERLGSLIANIKILNSNPLPGKEIRRGIIYNERDPEKFLFNYCFKSILSGIKSSLTIQKEK